MSGLIGWKRRFIEVLSSYTPEMNEEEVLRDLAARRPSTFRVNILGYGLVGEKAHEYLIMQDNLLGEMISEVRAFRRSSRPLGQDERLTEHPSELKTRMNRVQKGSMQKKVPSAIHEYYFLQELYGTHGLTDYLQQAGRPNPMSDILIVAPRYGFDETGISDADLEKARGTNLEERIHKVRANLAATFPHLDNFRGDTTRLIGEMQHSQRKASESKKRINAIIEKGMDEGIITKRDTASVPDHIIGAKALGDFLKEVGYQGFLLSIPNPLDIFTYTLMVHSGLPPSRVFGINMHDETRFVAMFMEELGKKAAMGGPGQTIPRYHFTEASIPLFGQHSGTQRPNMAKAYFSGVDNKTGETFNRVGIGYFGHECEKVIKDTLEFVAGTYIREFRRLQQGTAPETGDALISAIKAILLSSDSPELRQRGCGYVHHYRTGRPICDGIQARLTYRGAFPVSHWEGASDMELDGLRKGQDAILYLIEGLEKEGIIGGFTPEEADRREREYSKRHQNIDYQPVAQPATLSDEASKGGRINEALAQPGEKRTNITIGKVGTMVTGKISTLNIYMGKK